MHSSRSEHATASSKPRHVFLTGEPGIGKSTIVQAVRRRLGSSVAAVGFVTVEKMGPDGERSGFCSIDVADPTHTVQLASRTPLPVRGPSDEDPSEGHFVGPFRVHLADLDIFARRALAPAMESVPFSHGTEQKPGLVYLEQKPVLVYLDEVGAMQLSPTNMRRFSPPYSARTAAAGRASARSRSVCGIGCHSSKRCEHGATWWCSM